MTHQRVSIALLALAISFFCCATTAAAQDDGAIDAYLARQAQREQGEEYREARKIIRGDLTHDGIPETVVLYTIESQHGTNLYIQYLAVFVTRNGKLAPLTRAEVGGKSVRSVELRAIENNTIMLDTLNYGPHDPQCCPTLKGTTKYILNGANLREQKRKTPKTRGVLHATHPA